MRKGNSIKGGGISNQGMGVRFTFESLFEYILRSSRGGFEPATFRLNVHVDDQAAVPSGCGAVLHSSEQDRNCLRYYVSDVGSGGRALLEPFWKISGRR